MDKNQDKDQAQTREIIIEITPDFIVGNIETKLGDFVLQTFDRLRAANRSKGLIRQIFLRDPTSKQQYIITPVRDVEIHQRDHGIEPKLLAAVTRNKFRR